jgi:hypothetical protein
MMRDQDEAVLQGVVSCLCCPCITGIMGVVYGLMSVIGYKIFVAILGYPVVICHDVDIVNRTRGLFDEISQSPT